MKAISLWPPYAHLIGKGKIHETRDWYAKHRGPVAIHAAKNQMSLNNIIKMLQQHPDAPLALALRSAFGTLNAQGTIEKLRRLPTGVIVCTAYLEDCQPTQYLNPQFLDRMFGDWSFGRYAWKLTDIKILDRPIPAVGQQGFWEWHQG